MFKFFCSVCADDKDLYAQELDMSYAYATCPDCGVALKETYARHNDIKESEMTTESYVINNGLDNNTP